MGRVEDGWHYIMGQTVYVKNNKVLYGMTRYGEPIRPYNEEKNSMKHVTALVSGVSNGKAFENMRWEFTLLPPREGDYGNGRYILVVYPSGDFNIMDIRYGKPEMMPHVESFLRGFYGENMKSVQYSFEYEEE